MTETTLYYITVGPKIMKQQNVHTSLFKVLFDNNKSGEGGPMVWEGQIQTNKTRCVSHCRLVIYIK